MSVVSVRVDDEDLDYLRQMKVNLSETIRLALHNHIRFRKAEEAMARLAALAWKSKKSSVEMIREQRDARKIRD